MTKEDFDIGDLVQEDPEFGKGYGTVVDHDDHDDPVVYFVTGSYAGYTLPYYTRHLVLVNKVKKKK